MTFIKPKVDLDDPNQNEFVQDYLSAMIGTYQGKPTADTVIECDAIDRVIELIQETYNPHAPDDAAHHNH